MFKEFGHKKILATTYFSKQSLSSALKCLTSVFGMGTGEPLRKNHQYNLIKFILIVL